MESGLPSVFRAIGDHEVVGDGAALDVIFGAPGSVGIDLAFLVAVLLRVAVDAHRGGALALGGECFESTVVENCPGYAQLRQLAERPKRR